MGISVAASAQKSGHTVYWASDGRSEQTRARAEEHNLKDASTVSELCSLCSVIVSVCPPHAAEEVADEVATNGFSGLYLDANAISPERTARVGGVVSGAGGTFVDGGIIGGPAWEPGRTWLYLSGPKAEVVAACFADGPLETRVLDTTVGRASALKMCYAAYTKGTTALLCAVLAAAEASGVRDALHQQWTQDDPGFAEGVPQRVRRVTAKAWRFTGEMDEIAAAFGNADLPDGFHRAAAEVYHRIAEFKDAPTPPELEEVLSALLKTRD